jgi:TorA maturation chaperone TorD
MKCFLIFLTGFFLFSFASAQSAEDAVKAAFQKLFTGIKNSDAATVQSAFADSTVLQTITRKNEGKIVVVNETVQAFAALVAQLPK